MLSFTVDSHKYNNNVEFLLFLFDVKSITNHTTQPSVRMILLVHTQCASIDIYLWGILAKRLN